ncbi:MAG: AAA family ATPase [Solirubrobacterales bacterium]
MRDDAFPSEAFTEEVTVRRQRYVSAETGFAVLDCTAAGDEVVLVGPLAHLEERERARVSGEWVDDPRYGPQVRVRSAAPLPPSDEEAFLAYLQRVRHVGARRAQRLLDAYGEGVLDAIDADPGHAFAAAGLSGRRAAEAAASWEALRALRALHLLLAPHGLAYLAARIHIHYGDRAHRVVHEEPYALTSVFGVGFQTADAIATAAGVARDDPARARAALVHALAEAERSGSTCLPRAELMQRAGRLLGATPDPDRVAELVSAGQVVVEDGEWVYRTATAELEAELAERVRELLDGAPSDRLRVPASADGLLGAGVELADAQWDAVRRACAHRLSIVTGGPGTGKTASIKAICAIAARRHATILLVAPTGRAAVRMSEATGLPASTVHSALGWIPGQGPTHDEDHPLDGDLLIVDETSMATLELIVTLLRAVGPNTHVVCVGDADQLAPVGAGKPFADLVAAPEVPTTRLEHIFRQAAGSMIVQGAHAVRVGRAPSFRAPEEGRRDLFLIERPNPVAARKEIVSLVAERLPRHYGIDPLSDIQVFAPVYRGELGIDALNRDLREALNPEGERATARFRIGDKLMLTGRNLHDLGLMNGTLLRLIEVADDGERLLVASGDALIPLPGEELEHLQLAYACSVHKGQGIELPVAVVVAHPAAGAHFLRREMLYTAMTRASIATVVVGSRDVIARAARTTETEQRHSRLARRLEDRQPATSETGSADAAGARSVRSTNIATASEASTRPSAT